MRLSRVFFRGYLFSIGQFDWDILGYKFDFRENFCNSRSIIRGLLRAFGKPFGTCGFLLSRKHVSLHFVQFSSNF